MTDINEKIEYALWQKVTVPTEFIVYESAVKLNPTKDEYFVVREIDRRPKTVSIDYEKTGRGEIWCSDCKKTYCEHTEALFEFLRRKLDFINRKVEYEEYFGHWTGHLYPSGYDRFFNITKEKRTPKQ